MPPHLASSMSSSSNSSYNMMLLRPSANDNNNNSREDNNNNNIDKSSDNNNMLCATINNTPTDTGIRPVLSFTNLFNRSHSNNQKVQPNNNSLSKRSSSTPVLNNSASTNSMKQQWPCDLSLSNTSIYHTSMQNYNNYDSEETESNTSQSMGVQSSASVASTSDIDKSDTTERASNNAMDIFLSKAGINKQQQSKLQSMRLQQKQGMLQQQNNNVGGIQHVQLNDVKSKTQLNNNNANSILSRMVMVGSEGNTNNQNNNNGMPIRIASITDFRQSQGNNLRSSNSSMGNLRQSNRSSMSSRSKSRGSISRLNSRSSLGSVPENNVSTQNLCNSQWSLDRPDTTTSSNNQGGRNEVFKNLTRRRSSNISSASASQPNLRQRGGDRSTTKGGKNEQWSDPQTMVKAAGQRGEDIFAKLQELRLQKQIVMEKKEMVLKNSQRWSQPEMLNQMGSSRRGLSDSIKGVGGSAIDKNEEWPSSSPEEAGNTKSTARPVFQRDDKIDEIITLKLKIANQQATIDTLSSKLKTSSQDVVKPEVSQETIKELEAQNQSLTKQLQECQMREYKLVKELKAQQDDHEREMKQMEEKNLMLRKALEEALNSQQKSSISSGGSTRSRGSRQKTISTRSTSDDDESEDEDLAFKTDDQLDDSTKNKSYAWY